MARIFIHSFRPHHCKWRRRNQSQRQGKWRLVLGNEGIWIQLWVRVQILKHCANLLCILEKSWIQDHSPVIFWKVQLWIIKVIIFLTFVVVLWHPWHSKCPICPALLSVGTMYYPIEHAKKVIQTFRDYYEELNDINLSLYMLLHMKSNWVSAEGMKQVSSPLSYAGPFFWQAWVTNTTALPWRVAKRRRNRRRSARFPPGQRGTLATLYHTASSRNKEMCFCQMADSIRAVLVTL